MHHFHKLHNIHYLRYTHKTMRTMIRNHIWGRGYLLHKNKGITRPKGNKMRHKFKSSHKCLPICYKVTKQNQENKLQNHVKTKPPCHISPTKPLCNSANTRLRLVTNQQHEACNTHKKTLLRIPLLAHGRLAANLVQTCTQMQWHT